MPNLGAAVGGAYRVTRGYSAGHDAIDLAAATGTPVYSLTAGRVVFAANSAGRADAGRHNAIGGGNVVNVQDTAGTWQYAHLQSIAVAEGATVRAGQLLGTVGMTGNATGPHLHLGRQEGGRWIDPTGATAPPAVPAPVVDPSQRLPVPTQPEWNLARGNPGERPDLATILGKRPTDILTAGDLDRLEAWVAAQNPWPDPFGTTRNAIRQSIQGTLGGSVGRPIARISPDALGGLLGAIGASTLAGQGQHVLSEAATDLASGLLAGLGPLLVNGAILLGIGALAMFGIRQVLSDD